MFSLCSYYIRFLHFADDESQAIRLFDRSELGVGELWPRAHGFWCWPGVQTVAFRVLRCAALAATCRQQRLENTAVYPAIVSSCTERPRHPDRASTPRRRPVGVFRQVDSDGAETGMATQPCAAPVPSRVPAATRNRYTTVTTSVPAIDGHAILLLPH